MDALFQIFNASYINVHDGMLFADFPKRTHCNCGGRYSIRRKQPKRVRHSMLHNDTLYIQMTITTYRCGNCKQYLTDDGGLGVQHQTTAHYRKLAIQMVALTSLSHTARVWKIPKSTLAGWRKKALAT
ncbi:MAG: hypothetical protein KBT36_09170 [Kurthia sp.]|nr:hypothetical protein [Candidatus Kurthia equi]